jgi:hypothetical protein
LYGIVWPCLFHGNSKDQGNRYSKVLGGSVGHILWIFGKEFSRLIVIAFILAAPLGWWIMSRWLENYEYAFDMTWWVFAMEILIISFICFLTIGFRSAKAAMTNPVNSLKDGIITNIKCSEYSFCVSAFQDDFKLSASFNRTPAII